MNRILGTCTLITLMLAVPSCKDVGTPDTDWTPIADCIANVAVDYQSSVVVNDPAGVERVFNEYVAFARANNLDIFGYGNSWRFDSASKHGVYEGVKYWGVSTSWFSVQDNQWRKKNVFDVSDDGKVVRLLGCV